MKRTSVSALLLLMTLAITGLALASGAREASVERTEAQILAQLDARLAQRLAKLH